MDSALIPILVSVAALLAFAGFTVLGLVRVVDVRRKRRERSSRPSGHFVFAKILDGVTPMERLAKYEKPLQKALNESGYGIVTGGGTQLSRDNKMIEWVGLDMELVSLDEAVAFTCEKLRELGAPPGSELRYTVNGQRMTVQIKR